MRRLFSFVPWLLLALAISPLLVWAGLGVFTRYLADDYSTSAMLAQKGFWPVQVFWYQTWSGRYAYTFLISFVELAGVQIVPFLPFLSLSAWFFATFWALKQVFTALNILVEKKWLALLASVILFGSIKSLKDYTEVIFWQTGILTYQISNIFFAVCLAIFLKRFFSQAETRKIAAWEYIVAFALALAIGGFSETWIIIQVTLLTLALLYFAIFYKESQRNNILRILSVAYSASWCAFIAVVKSPGNFGRTTRMNDVTLPSIFDALLASIKDTPVFLTKWVSHNTALVIVLLLTGLVAGFWVLRPPETDSAKPRNHLLAALCLLVLAAGILSVGFFPAFVVWGMRPTDRAIFIPLHIFIWAFVLFGFFSGRLLNQSVKPGKLRLSAQVALLLTLVLTMGWVQARAALAAAQLFPTVQTYARLWDERAEYFRQPGLREKGNIVLPSLRRNPALHDIHDTIWITGELSEDSRNWINKLASMYYGVESISGK